MEKINYGELERSTYGGEVSLSMTPQIFGRILLYSIKFYNGESFFVSGKDISNITLKEEFTMPKTIQNVLSVEHFPDGPWICETEQMVSAAIETGIISLLDGKFYFHVNENQVYSMLRRYRTNFREEVDWVKEITQRKTQD